MTFSWTSDFVPSSLFAMKFRTRALGPLGTLPRTPRRIGIGVPPHDTSAPCHKSTESSMSALGQSRRFDDVRATSAFHLIAAKERTSREVSNVPTPEIAILIQFTRASVHHRTISVGDQRTGPGANDRTRCPTLLRSADGRLWERLTQ